MEIRSIGALLLPCMSWAAEPPECARAWVSSEYGDYVLSLRAGEPEVLSLGAGGRVALLAAPECRAEGVKISTEAVSGNSRLSSNLVVSPGKPTSLVIAGLAVELRIVRRSGQGQPTAEIEYNSQ